MFWVSTIPVFQLAVSGFFLVSQSFLFYMRLIFFFYTHHPPLYSNTFLFCTWVKIALYPNTITLPTARSDIPVLLPLVFLVPRQGRVTLVYTPVDVRHKEGQHLADSHNRRAFSDNYVTV